MRSVNSQNPLKLKRNDTYGKEELLERGTVIEIQEEDKRKGFYIFSTIGTGCEHPRDHTYMPWGYSPFINSSVTLRYSPIYIFIVLIVLLVNIT